MQDLWRAFLRLFFRLLYNELAWSYDIVAWLVSLGQWRAWGRTTLAHLQSDRVLELGHGPGHLLVTLARQGFAPVGLDLSPAMIRQAKKQTHRIPLKVPLVRARTQALPFRDGSFDNVVATFPTEFIVHPQTLREITRALVSEGRLIVAAGCRFGGKGLLSSLLNWLYRVTGQNQPTTDAFLPGLEEIGLSPRITWEKVRQTEIMLVVAEKAGGDPFAGPQQR